MSEELDGTTTKRGGKPIPTKEVRLENTAKDLFHTLAILDEIPLKSISAAMNLKELKVSIALHGTEQSVQALEEIMTDPEFAAMPDRDAIILRTLREMAGELQAERESPTQPRHIITDPVSSTGPEEERER